MVRLTDHGRDKQFVRHPGYSAHVILLHPKSRGQVALHSADPLASPKIQLNMLSHPDDVENLTVGVKKTRALLASSAFSEYLADEVFPGEDCQADEAIEAWLRGNAEHVYHPVGTCKMGVDAMAVVDPELLSRSYSNNNKQHIITFIVIEGAEHECITDSSIRKLYQGKN